MDELIQKQEEFCKWLKRHNLYDPSDSAHTMNKMQAVWNIYRENLKDLYENKYESDKLCVLIESMYKGKW